MDKIDSQILRLKSSDKNIRYDACKQLRIVPNLPQDAIAALEQASHDPDTAVAHAARRAMFAHQDNKIQDHSPEDSHGQKYHPGSWVSGTRSERYLCERCGRIIGEEIMACPDRPQGLCPYLLRDLMPLDSRAISAVGLIFSIFVLLFFRQTEGQSLPLFSGVIFCLIFIATLWGTFGTKTVLYNPISKLKWKRTAFLGIAMQCTLIPGGEQLRIDLSFSHWLVFPPSVTKFSEPTLKTWTLAHATAVFRAALVGLLARRVVQIHKYPKYVARWREDFRPDQIVYVLTASRELDFASIEGELERKIVLVLRSCVKKSWEDVPEWPDGAPIYEVVRAVFKHDVESPAQWVFDLVARDAVAHGWGRLEGWLRKRYYPGAVHGDQLQSELAIIDRLSVQLAQQQPAFSRALNDQIEGAVRSRHQQDHRPW